MERAVVAMVAVWSGGCVGEFEVCLYVDGIPLLLRDGNGVQVMPTGMGLQGKVVCVPAPYMYLYIEIIGQRHSSGFGE